MRNRLSGNVRKAAVLMAAACAFGVVMSVVKGNGGGVRDAIGNTSAPWLVLPFVAAAYWRVRRVLPGALVGLVASLTALAGFYIANSFVLDLGPHTWGEDLRLTVGAGRMFFALAILSGPLFGALGALWNRAPSTWPAVVVAALFVFEPFAAWLYGLAGHDGSGRVPVVSFAELALGVCACAAIPAFMPRLLRDDGEGSGRPVRRAGWPRR
jgi:hypothetical protein